MLKSFLLLLLSFLCFSSTQFSQTVGGQQAQILKQKSVRIVNGKYLLFLPEDYGKTKKRFPLIMYLHGGSLRGDDVEKVRKFGLPQLVENDKKFPFIVVSPLCPAGEIWTDTEMLIGILDEVGAKYRVDNERVYLTGHSMGGRGTWYLAYKYPERFAAIAPMSPNITITAWGDKLKDMPIWAFHGAKDEIALPSETQTLFDQIKKSGGGKDLKFTLLEDRDHFILDMYEDKNLYDWFLQHKRKRK